MCHMRRRILDSRANLLFLSLSLSLLSRSLSRARFLSLALSRSRARERSLAPSHMSSLMEPWPEPAVGVYGNCVVLPDVSPPPLSPLSSRPDPLRMPLICA